MRVGRREEGVCVMTVLCSVKNSVCRIDNKSEVYKCWQDDQ